MGGIAKRREQQPRQNRVLFRASIVVHKEPKATPALVSDRGSS